MLIFVQTRGEARAADYGFLGVEPDEPWWRTYREHTSFELPTLLLHSSGQSWWAFLSGIRSARRDAVGTTVRFTVALEGDCADDEDQAVALVLLHRWLADVTTGTRSVGAALDEAFPGPDVERLLTCRSEEDGAETRRRTLGALRALPAPAEEAGGPDEPADLPERWVGRLDAPHLPAALLRQTAELLSGVPGRALVLNLIGSRADAEALVEDDTTLAVLVDDDGGLGETAEGLHPKKAPAPSGTMSGEAAQPTRSRWSTSVRWLAAAWYRAWHRLRRRLS
ncbi:MAG: hypothetical protein ACRDRH_21010 [Pseudonocardia sp.]